MIRYYRTSANISTFILGTFSELILFSSKTTNRFERALLEKKKTKQKKKKQKKKKKKTIVFFSVLGSDMLTLA